MPVIVFLIFHLVAIVLQSKSTRENLHISIKSQSVQQQKKHEKSS